VRGPLTGIRVVELADEQAEYCGLTLAGLGADVVKVEPPGGDPMRSIYASLGARADAPNGAFIVANRGKRSIEMEIKQGRGREALDRLLATADVFVTNLRPDALARLGLEPRATCARFPRLVYCTLSAYGLGGPDQDRPGYDIAALLDAAAMVCEKFGVDPAAAGKAIGDVVPIRDAGFTKSPAEIDFFVAIERREIHQAGVEVLDLAADFLHSLECRFQIARGGVFAPAEQFGFVARRNHSAG